MFKNNNTDDRFCESTCSDGKSSDDNGVHSTDPYAALEQFAVQSHTKQLEPCAAADKYAKTTAEIAQFFENGDKLGASMQDSFASIFDCGLRRQPSDKQLLSVIEKYPRPQNEPRCIVPKTNDAVFEVMKRGPQIMDVVLSKALVPVIEIVDKIGGGQAKYQNVAVFKPLTDVVRLSSAAFSLLSQTMTICPCLCCPPYMADPGLIRHGHHHGPHATEVITTGRPCASTEHREEGNRS